MKHVFASAALAATLLATLNACVPVQVGASASQPVVLSRPDEVVVIAPGQTVFVAQTVTASVVGVEDRTLGNVNAETTVTGFRVTPNGLPLGWGLSLERATVLRVPLGTGSASSARVRLYLRVSAPKYPSKNPQALAYRVSYRNVDSPLALNVELRR